MNRAILTGSVIVGIAVVLTMTTLGTAYAGEPDYSCQTSGNSASLGSFNLTCDQAVATADHVLVRGINSHGICHFDVLGAGSTWIFFDDTPEKGSDCITFSVLKNHVTLR